MNRGIFDYNDVVCESITTCRLIMHTAFLIEQGADIDDLNLEACKKIVGMQNKQLHKLLPRNSGDHLKNIKHAANQKVEKEEEKEIEESLAIMAIEQEDYSIYQESSQPEIVHEFDPIVYLTAELVSLCIDYVDQRNKLKKGGKKHDFNSTMTAVQKERLAASKAFNKWTRDQITAVKNASVNALSKIAPNRSKAELEKAKKGAAAMVKDKVYKEAVEMVDEDAVEIVYIGTATMILYIIYMIGSYAIGYAAGKLIGNGIAHLIAKDAISKKKCKIEDVRRLQKVTLRDIQKAGLYKNDGSDFTETDVKNIRLVANAMAEEMNLDESAIINEEVVTIGVISAGALIAYAIYCIAMTAVGVYGTYKIGKAGAKAIAKKIYQEKHPQISDIKTMQRLTTKKLRQAGLRKEDGSYYTEDDVENLKLVAKELRKEAEYGVREAVAEAMNNVQPYKTFTNTFIYTKKANEGSDLERHLMQYIMQADRIDRNSSAFDQIKNDMKTRQTSAVLYRVMMRNDVVLAMYTKELPASFKVFRAMDVRSGDGKPRIFIDLTGIVKLNGGYLNCSKIDTLCTYLMSALVHLLYFNDNRQLVTNATITRLSTVCFMKMFCGVLDQLRVLGYMEHQVKIKYITCVYFLHTVIGKPLETARTIAANITNITQKDARNYDYYYDEASLENIDTFVTNIAESFKLKGLSTDIVIDRWILMYGKGTMYGLELYHCFLTILTSAYCGAYVNNQKTIETFCGREMVDISTTIIRMGDEVFTEGFHYKKK